MTAAKIEQIPRLADDAGRVAIIAGNGLLPISVAEALEAAEKKPFLVPLRGEADPVLYKYEHQEISIVEFAKLVRSMKAAGVDRVVLAGGVTSRPHVSDLKFDWPTLRAVPYVLRALGQGDDALYVHLSACWNPSLSKLSGLTMLFRIYFPRHLLKF